MRGLRAQGATVAIAGRPEVLPSPAADALRVFPLAEDTTSGWEAVLDEIMLTWGGADLLLTAPGETAIAERCAPLLALSPAGGRILE